MIEASVTIDLSDLHKFGSQVENQLIGASSGPVAKALKQWGARYRSFAQERYDTFSKGGGDWPPLAESTIRARRKGGKKVSIKTLKTLASNNITAVILRDLGLLFAVLTPTFTNVPGSIQENIPFGIRVGFGGTARHANGKGVSIADIAEFQQTGAGRLPVRKIIVPPTQNVLQSMASDMQKGLDQLAKDLGTDR